MRIGYARVSTREQNLDRQVDALNAAGCERIYLDKISTRRDFVDRPEWSRMWEALRAGDTLVVHELDRMGRSLTDLLEIVRQLEERGVELVILSGMFGGLNLGDQSPMSRLLFQMAAAFAEYERSVNRSRTLDGLAAARKRGMKGGRKFALNPDDAALCVALYRDPNVSVASIARRFGVSTDTVRAYARRAAPAKIKEAQDLGNATPGSAINAAASLSRNADPSGQPHPAQKSPPSVTSGRRGEGRTVEGGIKEL